MIRQAGSVAIGCLEEVSFPDLGLRAIWAKVDTGAYSGAIHCTEVKVVRRAGERILKFQPSGTRPQETTNFHSTYVRSATGHRMRRHIIDTSIVIEGHTYPIHIGVSDRSTMKWPVLLGRRFLREQNILVDVRINQELDDEWETAK